MRSIAGSCRFVDNKALALQKARYEQGEKKRDQNILSRGMEIWREKGGTRPDGLWIEPQGWSEAGTHRSDAGAVPCHP